ncbi:hypothetical protein MOK15_18535 [Sphingobium sp. BYY-5]|uniref:hypothetical protein n=1 Tax=Sphingobium sp. BYY-5 TaxID=2926400 RepID=UPI001FA78CA0|nr:hypothetical protein [Sphingobium sp. BYY-5]MCI4592089.1 hypothetical protein [Sphingobium sp. BYY-5]
MTTATPSQPTIFSADILDAMFQAVEIDDVVDPVVCLPSPIPVDCTQDDMRRCLDLCRQFWREGAIRADMRDLTGTLLLTGELSQDARVRYKHIRARYKHLRFALVLYGTRHRPPLLFAWTVATMGHLQDAFRHRQRLAVLGYGLILRLFLSWPLWIAVQREVQTVRLDDPQGFLAFRKAEFSRLRTWLRAGSLTSHRFHAMRKIISRQVSFYDTMRTLKPDDQMYRMSRFLSAINGLMGSMHDDLVEQAGTGHRNYHRDLVPLPTDIRQRLEAITAHYPA